ncbi:protein-L-isoaspartate O-methyltransferase family protein [Cupriavidus oxalaticus]|jgi:protein-L-isoaspartate(D-aspartate) O-methyltransferase|uniref:Protein-L-isoaspartate O-methyltransferase n=1 Tax=Cupriavidus oxalaticus TaxID=96344 RepID=A0A976BCK6_9BURK|nr:protein-L-isoaspartate O-methyltransferase [Cupriavidus oxalaticus]QRQ88170.1 protein-L-isoaspartate O-methyltransferase [Cupriavidus oxalaticus]QRQ93503.1 protein-L-isoaspartate O-methyltransferase [Cupriavidus oxalaticus]WQD82130.1 protein-L-isoaspartate O-methyltransferase [Cupriavidus oxalaticus]SPC14248.1 Protein-L-isoaspartate O-methyltransferase [Cupriavidus oxalaticus]
MDLEKARFNMIEQQIRPWDVLDQEILDLLAVVKREQFVPAAYASLAFVDMEIPLPAGQNMLPPRVEARILQDLAVRKHENVLEIGAGSGYMAALLANRARHVLTVDIVPELVELARTNLANAGITNVDVAEGNAADGWAAAAPYDVICISGSLPALPQSILSQVKVGGRIAAFVGELPVMEARLITRVSETEYQVVNLFETAVKPLQGAARPSQFQF